MEWGREEKGDWMNREEEKDRCEEEMGKKAKVVRHEAGKRDGEEGEAGKA